MYASLIRRDGISCLFDYSIITSINYDYGFLGPWLIQDHLAVGDSSKIIIAVGDSLVIYLLLFVYRITMYVAF